MAIESFSGKYRFLSNFWAAEVNYFGISFVTVENAYQAAKCKNVEDMPQFQLVTPANAKKLGRYVKIREDWEEVKVPIMEKLVFQKFLNHPELTAALLATGDEPLIEGNTWGDTFWGKCGPIGHNKLGHILMNVRTTLRLRKKEVDNPTPL